MDFYLSLALFNSIFLIWLGWEDYKSLTVPLGGVVIYSISNVFIFIFYGDTYLYTKLLLGCCTFFLSSWLTLADIILLSSSCLVLPLDLWPLFFIFMGSSALLFYSYPFIPFCCALALGYILTHIYMWVKF